MSREHVVLAGLAPARGALHSPVQVQKLFFLLDRELASRTSGPHFNFRPYHYGPFDQAVYRVLEGLASQGLVEIVGRGPWRTYRLTAAGQREGERRFRALPIPARRYIRRASEFVRSLSFTDLVSAIYKAYPEMRANSVFSE